MLTTHQNQSLFAEILAHRTATLSKPQRLALELTTIFTGIVFMALLAQVQFRLPWTVVPVTGQTFGVAFLALFLGSRRAVAAVAGYLAVGALGAPVFALGQAGLTLGPTAGYLAGMVVAAGAVGALADRGWAKTFWGALLSAYIGSFFIFSLGLLGLALFVGNENLLAAGLWPFLPGDFIKNFAAAALVHRLNVKITGRRR